MVSYHFVKRSREISAGCRQFDDVHQKVKLNVKFVSFITNSRESDESVCLNLSVLVLMVLI